MIVMAGRQAQPAFPVGPFYVKDLSLFGFAMFNATPDEQRAWPRTSIAGSRRRSCTCRSARRSPRRAAAAHRFLEDNTLHKAGTLTGKVVLHP